MTGLLVKLFIKDSENVSSPNTRKAYGILGGVTGICCNLFLFVIKIIIGIASGSISIIAEAFNNLSDIGSSVVTMLGFKLASKPADKEHPFGHGRMEYMSGFIVSIIIIVVGLELLKSAFDKIINPSDVGITAITFLILGISVFVKLWMNIFFKKLGKKIDSSALMATARDSINDVVSTSAVFCTSLLLYFTDINIDGYVGVVVAIFIMFGGFKSAVETLNPLLGETPDKELIKSINEEIMLHGEFVGTHDLVVHSYGPGRMFASVHVEVPSDIDIISCHEIIDDCERDIAQKLGVETVIHMDPIVINDNQINELRNKIRQIVTDVDAGLCMHDFRMVKGVTRDNLIFDIVVPYDFNMDEKQIKDKVCCAVSQVNERYNCVINIDRGYV